ncbi:hypothetical protein E6R60_26250 [Streptomyces sp. A0642]|uniref:hypothetical protein n=1 Tax=Streptomyces sp. A0642 TaxID=2563100 RepID=UPI0010A21A23|nr:hypothetical protein [Streptomyces sp. A0642]THA72438.1 hypothetical protein E6R60_26250 [Streptomyces sp. A0642]
MPQTMEPIIIDQPPDHRTANPRTGDYLLYDDDFAKETDPKYQPIDPTQTLYVPHFPVGEVSRWILGKNLDWLKYQLKKTPLRYGNTTLVFRMVPGRTGTERRLTLADIERLAWALNERGAIDGFELRQASDILVAVARQYGVGSLDPEKSNHS